MSHPLERESSPKSRPIGLELFEKVFNFYSWYLSYDNNPSQHHQIFKTLSLMMQIAKVSYEGALFLTKEEEHHAVKGIQELSEALYGGQLKNHELLHSLEAVLKKLTDNNPKAKLISTLMKLEYNICIHNNYAFDPPTQASFKELLNAALYKVKVSLPNLMANSMIRELESLQTKICHPQIFLQHLKKALLPLDQC